MTRRIRKDGQSTRENILEASTRLFAEDGYHKTTVADICHLAGANIAAVNYHFGSKEALYVESWRHSFANSLKAHPPDGGVPLTAPAEDRFRGMVYSLVARMMDEDSRNLDIMRTEMANPTGLLTEATQEAILPLREGLAKVIRELLGTRADEESVLFCKRSVMAQCFGSLLRERNRRKAGIEKATDTIDSGRYAEHVIRFSLAGIKEKSGTLQQEKEADQ